MREFLHFLLKNFLVPIVFFIADRLAGPKAAIAFAVGMAIMQVAVQLARRIPLSPFFVVSSGFTLVFGGIDLMIRHPQFYRLEPFAQSMVIGAGLSATLFMKVPMLEWFARALPTWAQPEPGEVSRRYYRGFTAVLALYFFLKALLYLYMAHRLDLGTLVMFRSVFGVVSLGLLLVAKFVWRKKLRPRRHRRAGAGKTRTGKRDQKESA